MPTWSIGYSEQERIDIELLSPPADDGGYDWVSARARIAVGAFRADIDMALLASDMVRFSQALEPVCRDLRGAAEFTTIEDQLYFRLEVDDLGHVRVTGRVRDQAGIGNQLTFELTFDQTFLSRTLSELRGVLSQVHENGA